MELFSIKIRRTFQLVSTGRGKEFLHLSYERQSLADVGGNLSFFF